MTRNYVHLFASLLLAVSSVPAMAQSQASCTFTTFQVPGYTGTSPQGINRYGTVVGSAFVTSNLPRRSRLHSFAIQMDR